MKKIVTSGLLIDNNFGSPSILHGFNSMCEKVIGDDYEIINIQTEAVLDNSPERFPFKTIIMPKNRRKLLLGTILKKIGIKTKDREIEEFLNIIYNADYVIDLFGICFCDSFVKNGDSAYKVKVKTIGKFIVPFIGRCFGKKTVKYTSSFGPMNEKNSRVSAEFAKKHIFDAMIAREFDGELWMDKLKGKAKILVAPDTALLMPYENICNGEQYISLSVSAQMRRSWKYKVSYEECIVDLCKFIDEEIKCKVYLVVNETLGNDTDQLVAEKIKEMATNNNLNLEIKNNKLLGSKAMKNIIAGSQMCIASRYHSCVAALSSNVPLLVIGWHNKYVELMSHYKQDKYILSAEKFELEKVKEITFEIWNNRQLIKENISNEQMSIQKEILKVGRKVFDNEND